MKKFIAILSMFLFTFTSSTSTLVYANELQTNSKSVWKNNMKFTMEKENY